VTPALAGVVRRIVMTTAIRALRERLHPPALRVVPVTSSTAGNEMQHASLLMDAIMALWAPDAPPSEGFSLACSAADDAVRESIAADPAADRCVGAMAGLCIGDAVGAPLEFIPADSSAPPFARGGKRRSWLAADLGTDGRLQYESEHNKFRLLRGQWTDDCSMSLCLADSLLARGTYHGGDCRTRYHLWWHFGYNNAFRFDDTAGRHSVGLGGNISRSLEETMSFSGGAADDVPGRFTAAGEDAGNGSIMRLAPVPVRFHADVGLAMAQAMEQSYATHPGPDAAACCAFLAFVVCRAIHRDAAARPETVAEFLDRVVAYFLATVVASEANAASTGLQKLGLVLRCAPPSEKEAVWRWRDERLAIEATLRARGPGYNGYPVSAGYFGSYCMDGLSMALWALYHSSSFTRCILEVVNLLGDADTTGAIAGQMAGAFHGFSSIASDALGAAMVRDMRRWDPVSEIPLRALLLHQDGCREAGATFSTILPRP
jgi:ADP-ribosyl-[dinitrogen reductase] hydrolase